MAHSIQFTNAFLQFLLLVGATPVLAQGGVTRYCQSGVAGAQIFASGSADFAANGGAGDLLLSATGSPANVVGAFFYSSLASSGAPFGNGWLCMATGAPLYRLPVVVSDVSGGSSLALDYLAPPHPSAQITPGSTWNFQHWFRVGASFDLTDALAIQFVPPLATPFHEIKAGPRNGHPLGQTFDGGAVLIDNQQDFDLFWPIHDGHVPVLTPPAINFAEEVLVTVYAGRRFTSGYSVGVTSIDMSVTAVDVGVIEYQPGLGCGVLYSEMQPYQMVVVRRADALVLRNFAHNYATTTCP